MWKYIYTDELYHHGVPGMKWGVRKAEPSKGGESKKRRTNSDTKYNDYYVSIYGKKGANRINKRMNEKGYTRKKAVRMELGRKITIGLLSTAATGLAVYSIGSGKVSSLASKGMEAVRSFADSKTKAYMLDKSGNVIKRYWKSPVREVVTDLVRI